MNGPHDLGGAMGFGPIAPEVDEPLFHAAWERRAMGLTVLTGTLGAWNIDESRHARENRHPLDYYRSSYYEIWIKGLERLLIAHSLVSEQELRAGDAQTRAAEPKRIAGANDIPAILAKGAPVDRPADKLAGFAVGDRVRTMEMAPSSHTRLPRYARGKIGTVEMVHGVHVFPDSNAHGQGEHPQWLYTVAFEARALWGRNADPASVVSIDAFEPYLDPVTDDA